VVEQRGRVPARRDLVDAVAAPPGVPGDLLQVVESGPHGGGVRGLDLRHPVLVAERPEGADGLRGGERPVVAGDRTLAPRGPELPAGGRGEGAPEQRLQLPLLDHAAGREAEVGEPAAVPAAGRVPVLAVVLARPAGHRGLVVAPRPAADLRTGQHEPTPTRITLRDNAFRLRP